MKIHFIAIGGSAMHNLALALHNSGYEVTGSDSEIFEPSRSRLDARGLLPEPIEWNEDRIHKGLDAVILGMKAKEDNPELLKARKLDLKIYSYPEFLYQAAKNKKRVVIGGSHGKTSITSMILHVLMKNNIETDYMVGAQLEGFDTMVKISDAPLMILEGDEYLSSPIDRRPKFHLYQPHLALLSGIAWDHINVFPTFENYVKQFSQFADLIEANGKLIYFEQDPELQTISKNLRSDIQPIPYSTPIHIIEEGITYLIKGGKRYPLEIFGEHNLQNLQGAIEILKSLGLEEETILNSMSTFSGASKRLELVKRSTGSVVYKDFAHSPSKLKATTNALKEQYPDRQLIACMELHTYSSLNKEFLSQYQGAMEKADRAFVYFNPTTIKNKRLEPISENDVANGFGNTAGLQIFTDSKALRKELVKIDWNNKNLLLMSSGNFDGIDFEELADELIA